MKHLFVLISLLLAAASYGIYLSDTKYSNEFSENVPRPLFVKNISSHALDLYPESPDIDTVVATFEVSEIARFRYQGKTGQRIYIYKRGEVLSIRDGGTEKGVSLFSNFLSLQSVWRVLLLMAVFSAGLYFIALIVATKQKNKQRKKSEELSLENERLKHAIAEAKNKNTQLNHHIIEKDRVLRKEEQRVNALQVQNSQKSQALEDQIQRDAQQRNRLIEQYEQKLYSSESLQKQFEHKAKVTVSELETSLKDLETEMEKLQQDIRTFDIDYKDPRFNGILKGRMFEIYIAKILVEEFGCEILEWTPDKGFLHKLKVKQNGNPDLVFKTVSGVEFAIECKFRSGYGALTESL